MDALLRGPALSGKDLWHLRSNYIPGVSEISFNVDFYGHLFSVPQVLSNFLEVDFLWIVEIFHHGVAEIEVTETLTTLAAFPRVFMAWTALNRQPIIKAVLQPPDKTS